VRFGFGLITCQRDPRDRRTDAELYREAVELCVLAEQAGFDSVWTSEHHFVDDGYMPSLLVVSAAIAQATERVSIGTGVLLAPLHHPLRLAEDAATLDLLSGGRFILGLGAGWREEEFELLGADIRRRPSAMTDTVSILRGAWSGRTFSYEGKVHSVERAFVTPQPSNPIPIWIGGFAEPAIRRAGELGDAFIGSSSGTSGIEAFAQARRTALEGVRGSGRDERGFGFALHVPVFAWTDGDAWETVKEHYHYLRWKYPDMGAARGSDTPGSPPALDPETEEKLRATIICGTPEEVIAEIAAYRQALGDDIHFIFRSYFPGMPYEIQRRAVEVLGSLVLPALR